MRGEGAEGACSPRRRREGEHERRSSGSPKIFLPPQKPSSSLTQALFALFSFAKRNHGSRQDQDRQEGELLRIWPVLTHRDVPRGVPRDDGLSRCPSQASKQIIESYYSRLTLDFNTNKRVAEEVAIIPTKRLRNKIAGYTTHLMKRIQRGPVRGISLKLQEEERERRMDFVPEESAINVDAIEVDRDTMDLLRSLNMGALPGVSLQQTTGGGGGYGGYKARVRGAFCPHLSLFVYYYAPLAFFEASRNGNQFPSRKWASQTRRFRASSMCAHAFVLSCCCPRSLQGDRKQKA